jgi:pyruvate dehydrogenase E1 component alpha subunit
MMPRETIKIAEKIESIRILDEKGDLDESLTPDISPELLRKLHRFMLLGRRFDERQLNLQRQGRLGTFPPITGQEASQLGAVAPLSSTDWMVPSFRETAAELFRGRSLESILLANNGYSEGGVISEEMRNLPVSIPVGSQILHAVGLAWAIRYRGRKEVAMAFFGDGATSEGDFHEGLNFAGVFQVPAVFVCQNNQWAISIPRDKQTRSRTIAQKAVAYGIPGVQVDGNDILAVYLAAQEAISRARSGEGPTLIECVTYRMSLHTTADDPRRYREEHEVERWKQKDPLRRFQRFLKARNLIDDAAIKALETELAEVIQKAVETAEAQMKRFTDPLKMFDHVYAERPEHLAHQLRALSRELENAREEAGHG